MQIIFLCKKTEVVFTNKKRLGVIYLAFIAAVTVICARLYTIADSGSQAREVLAGQYTRRMDIADKKGAVYDRNGVALDTQEDGYIIFVDSSNLGTSDEVYAAAEEMNEKTGVRESYILEKLLSEKPFTFISETPYSTDVAVSFEKRKEREDEFLCHLVGYRGSDGEAKTGAVKAYDGILSNDCAGSVYVRYEADASGGVMLGSTVSLYDDGYTEKKGVYLTIDEKIQRIAEEACADVLAMGAVVVQDTESGEILAMLSRPAFGRGEVAELLTSESGELVNRALCGYTPGSVFKTVVAASALEAGISPDDRVYECKGYIDVSGEIIRCHNIAGHGKLNMNEAFAQSCNPYFIDLGLEVGIDRILACAKSLGIGTYSEIDGISVSRGMFPTDGLDRPALVANTSVGQGELLLTPVQVCSMMSSAATGVYRVPRLVSKIEPEGAGTEYINDTAVRVFKDDTVGHLRSMLRACVTDGTGYRVRSDKAVCAGKTATAQSGQIKDGKEVIHTWFAGYFPADKPKYTVCVLCDGNSEENANASTVFLKVAEAIVDHESQTNFSEQQ